MVTKPFLAARIPEDLNTKLEEHSASTGEGKTQAVINALAQYLNFTPESKSEESAGDRLSLLEKKVAELEKLLKEPKQISMALDVKPAIAKEVAPSQITTDNKSDNKEIDVVNPSVIITDNSIDNTNLITANQEEFADNPRQDRGKFVDRMRTQDISNLPGLENEDSKKIRIKLQNTKKSKSQSTKIGCYFIKLGELEDVAIDKPKYQKALWDVYEVLETQEAWSSSINGNSI